MVLGARWFIVACVALLVWGVASVNAAANDMMASSTRHAVISGETSYSRFGRSERLNRGGDRWRAEVTEIGTQGLSGIVKIGVGKDAEVLSFRARRSPDGVIRGTFLREDGSSYGQLSGFVDGGGASGTFEAGEFAGQWEQGVR